jgi:ankyrin repeat protein
MPEMPSGPAPTPQEPTVARFLRDVRDGRLDEVRAALAASPQLVNTTGPHPYWGGRPQPLHMAIEGNQPAIFELLLDAGADVDGSNDGYDHWSPLMLAVHNDRAEMRQALLARGARVGLVEALLFADDALVRELLAVGRAALPAAEPNGGSLLAFARTPSAIDRLLELGVSTDRRDRWGASPIEAMSRLGPRGQPLFRHLVSRGVAAEPQDFARLGDREALAALIAADPVLAGSDAVMMGAVDFGHRALVEWLLAQGGNANARAAAQSRHTALHSAAWNGDLGMVELLVAAGADPTARDKEHDNTPLGWAEVAVTVTGNPRCREVVGYLSRLAGPPVS